MMQDPNAQPAPQGAPQQEGGNGDAAVKAMMQVKDVLAKLQEIAPKGFPPEAQKLLSTAASSFDGFLQMVLGGGQGAPEEKPAPQPAPGPQSAMAAGPKNAVPA